MTTATRTNVFDRVVCGVDRSAAGLAAARAAALVTDPAGSLTLVSANDTSLAVHAGWGMGQILEKLAAEAAAALDEGTEAAHSVHSVEGKLFEGDPLHSLLAEIERQDATIVVVGSHGNSRATGIALRSVATYLLHEAPCSVLVARGEIVPGHWPRRIVVGLDGSEHSALAHRAACDLGRLTADVRAVVATRESGIDLSAARSIAPGLEEYPSRPLDLLSVYSAASDLMVVGSRGLRGIRALGSLSERLAHATRSSVLVVRGR